MPRLSVFGSCLSHIYVVVVAVLFGLVTTSKLNIKEGGFEEFVVAVGKDVPYTPEIVDQLQVLVQETSDRLYEVTGLHLRSANILVPSSWHRERTWEKTDQLTFTWADLRVDKPHPYYRNRPYTQPTWQCGQMQNYIHVTPDFVRDKKHRLKADTLLANQFASYRWGVFDDIIKDTKNGDSMSKTQEKVCNGIPVWDVIKAHEDYRQSGKARKQITFTIVYNENDESKEPEEKECGRPVVMLLDFSGSMSTENRFFRQQQAGTKFIHEILPFGTELGIIAFATSPKRLVNRLEKITGGDIKDQMASYLTKREDNSIGASTGIGRALKAGLQMLKESGYSNNESRIVLLTDGEENDSPAIAEVLPLLIASKVKVHSIAVGDSAAEDLGRLCQKTGGQLGKYVFQDPATLTQVVNNLWGDFNMLCVEERPIEVENRVLLLDKDHPIREEKVAIDSSIKDAEITFTPEHGNIEVTVTGPDKTTYNDKSPEYREELHTRVIKFTFKNMEPGEWKSKVISKSVTARSSGDKKEQVIMNVKAKAKEETQTYEVRSWLNSVIVTIPAVTTIYAEVTQGYAPLIKAKVTATVEGTVKIKLKDDGIWPDVRALDGIYTGEFQMSTTAEDHQQSASSSPKSERYSVDITVTPVEGQTSVVHKLSNVEDRPAEEWAGSLFDLEITEKDIEAEPVEPFHRKTSPGAFEIKNITHGIDQYPPSRVVDLSMTGMKDLIITLEWTAPGDDLRDGTASEYEVRVWHNETQLRKNLTRGIILRPYMEAKLSPSPSGTQEVFKFKLPDNWPFPYAFIAMVSRDDALHQSKVSNVVKLVHPGPVYDIMSDHVSLFAYAYTTVYFITRLIEVSATRR